MLFMAARRPGTYHIPNLDNVLVPVPLITLLERHPQQVEHPASCGQGQQVEHGVDVVLHLVAVVVDRLVCAVENCCDAPAQQSDAEKEGCELLRAA